MSKVEVYTDGSCIGNPGPGGWAAIVLVDGQEASRLSGGEDNTTSNRMELTAAIEGLKGTPKDMAAHVFSDSRYLVNTMTRGWRRRKNNDLWNLLDAELAGREVTWEWVKAHAGNPMNERVDRRARSEAKSRAGDGTEPAPGLTHVDQEGRGSMVDVGAKEPTDRIAVAKGRVRMAPNTLSLIKENAVKKGDVLGIAMVAGITGAKSTSTLIPLCHPLPLDQISVEFELDEEESSVEITATARTHAKTGVEMEALTAVSVAALTIYDMCKASDRAMKIEGVRLVRKTGGRSGDIKFE